ncbi:hypothetical protein M0813_29156 [Anaeramoeba flamelloides]|uniref:Uncharacterized protein n=1 Tax=Anaeramoeba flamelloides TaxID=1746091 RepID=A0ABQ8XPM1_9EUKA|nr:hypothetical protein M0813_29156 [Anaeramoeba flamelloides]
MKSNINKLFLKNLPKDYSIDKLVQLIKLKTGCSPNIEIIQNKKNPNNGLARLAPFSKENEITIKQRLSNNFDFENRRISIDIYDKQKKEKESENINWKSKTLKDLELELDNYRINQLKNSPSWKVRKYLKIVTIQGNINKQQKYLKWKGSTSILKLRTFTNYLNRYSYVMNEDKSKFCKLCKKINNLDIIEDLDHFLWNCPAYENNRKIWISELKNINISHILKNNNISNIIDRKRFHNFISPSGKQKYMEIFKKIAKSQFRNSGKQEELKTPPLNNKKKIKIIIFFKRRLKSYYL